MLKRVITFIKKDVWNLDVATLPKLNAFGVQALRVVLIATKDFIKDRCLLRASALTYYTLLTVVPVLALAFGIAQGFGLDKILEEQLYVALKGQEEVVEQMIGFIDNLLKNTSGGVIAGVGVVILLFSVMRILHNIEVTLNTIWQVKEARTILKKVSDYITFTIVAPMLLALSSSLTVYITTTVKKITNNVVFLENAGPLITSPLKLLPYIIIALLLTSVYIVFPNKKVLFKAAFIGGIIAGTAYNLVQWGYITFQVGTSNFNAIYGSFAALPLFLIWVQLSWSIVLYGAEISFAVQNVHRFNRPIDVGSLSPHKKRLISLLIVHLIATRFRDELPPISASKLADKLKISGDLIGELLIKLQKTGLISAVIIDQKRKELGYQCGRDINQLTVYKVVNLLEQNGISDIDINDNSTLEELKKTLSVFYKAAESTNENTLLIDIK